MKDFQELQLGASESCHQLQLKLDKKKEQMQAEHEAFCDKVEKLAEHDLLTISKKLASLHLEIKGLDILDPSSKWWAAITTTPKLKFKLTHVPDNVSSKVLAKLAKKVQGEALGIENSLNELGLPYVFALSPGLLFKKENPDHNIITINIHSK